jgi:hypothetical protein
MCHRLPSIDEHGYVPFGTRGRDQIVIQPHVARNQRDVTIPQPTLSSSHQILDSAEGRFHFQASVRKRKDVDLSSIPDAFGDCRRPGAKSTPL